jgi:hypothetical protein
LGYTLNKRAIREIVRKINEVVGIGERKWGDDFRRRMMMFETMVESKYIDV